MLLPLLAFLSSWLTPTSVASRNLVTCATKPLHDETNESEAFSLSSSLHGCVCVRESEGMQGSET